VPASPGLSTARTRCGSIVTASSSISHTATRRRQRRVERNMVRNGSSDETMHDIRSSHVSEKPYVETNSPSAGFFMK
jgi:hypothetical protein